MAAAPGPLRYALLALLARQPQSGYDLAAKLGRRIAPFWQAPHSQIYPTLAALEADGLVLHSVVAQSDRPDRKVYVVTREGKKALRAWVTSPLPDRPPRDELVLRAYAVSHADRPAAAAMFREQARAREERAAEYEARLAELERKYGRAALGDPDEAVFGSFATLKRGIGYEREYASWCAWMADRLAR